MAWKHGFVIDYAEGDGKGLSCSKCRHFDEDKSCRVTGQRMPEVGYDCWRNCRWFELSAKHETARNRKALESFCERRGFGFDEWDPKKAAKPDKARSKAIRAAAKARRIAEIESFGLAPGSTVNSRRRGEGTVVSLEKKTVTVSFGGDHATFPYPGVFLNGGLSIGKARPDSVAKPAQPKAADSDVARIVPGATVSHMTFGYGIVQSVAAGEARISFDGDKVKIVPIEKAVAARELKPVAPPKTATARRAHLPIDESDETQKESEGKSVGAIPRAATRCDYSGQKRYSQKTRPGRNFLRRRILHHDNVRKTLQR